VSDNRTKILNALEEVRTSRSIDRLYRMTMLREMTKSMPFVDLLHVINLIDDETDLNILLGIGMKGMLYYAIMKRKATLHGV